MIRSISIKTFILAILMGLGLTTSIVSFFSGQQLKQAALRSQEKVLSNIINVSINESISQLRIKMGDFAKNVASDKEAEAYLKAIIKNSKVSTTEENQALNSNFYQRFNTLGIIVLKKVRLYNKKLELVGVSTEGEETLSGEMPEILKNEALARKGAERLKSLDHIWIKNHQTYYSTLLPVGGFRLKGYIEIVVDLPYSLRNIEKIIAMPIAIISPAQEVLYKSKQDDKVDKLGYGHPVSYIMTHQGEKLLEIIAQVDISEFKNSTNTTQWLFSGIFLLVVLGFILLSIVLLGLYLFKPLKLTVNAIEKFAKGDIDARFGNDGLQELGTIGNALDEMQQQVKARILETELLLEDNLKVKQALDNASACLILTDQSNQIIYANGSVCKLFRKHHETLGPLAPEMDLNNILHTNLATFSSSINPLLRSPDRENPQKFSIEYENLFWEIISIPVIYEGKYIATILEINDASEEKSVEKEINLIVDKIRHGDLSERLDLVDKNGFFLQLSESINDIVNEISFILNAVAGVMSSMAAGDLTKSIDGELEGIFQKIKNDVNGSCTQLNGIIEQIVGSSEFVRSKTQEISSGNQNLSQRAEDQSCALEETAASMEQLVGTVKNNAENASQASSLAKEANKIAVKGGSEVNHAISAMKEIQNSSVRISEIINVIDEISFQTNLLALNASVEAARASEHGRGFAVVAEEVRNLAKRSSQAAKEIKGLIEESVVKIKTGSSLVSASGETLNDIVRSVGQVSTIINQIALSSDEQTKGIEQVNHAVTQMEELTQQNAALAEETSASSQSSLQQTEHMTKIVSFFKT